MEQPNLATTMATCPKCLGAHDYWTLARLFEAEHGQHRPVSILCGKCQELSPFADWLRQNGMPSRH